MTIYPVRIYSPTGKLKQTISTATLVNRIYDVDVRLNKKRPKKYKRSCIICGKVTERATPTAKLCGGSKCGKAHRTIMQNRAKERRK